MQLDILKNIGLTDGEVNVYQTLLEGGELSAGELIKKTALKRGDCYNKIYDLKAKQLIEESNNQGKKLFKLGHPVKIEEFIDKRYREIAEIKKEVSALIPGVISTYNLSYHKPGVSYFEGEEGFKQITEDSLSASGEIYSYVDVEAVEKYVGELNKKYVKKREQLGTMKKIIVTDTEYNRLFFKKMGTNVTEVRYIDYKLPPFSAVMQIYDNKISYLTLKPKSMVGIIIEDEMIASMQKGLFEYNWFVSKI
jgi:sugar-specific transcriptional regulator TrmB